MSEPAPVCPSCGTKSELFYGKEGVPAMHYGNRPPWTYNDVKNAKRVSDGKNSYEIDSSYGGIGSMHRAPKKVKGRKK